MTDASETPVGRTRRVRPWIAALLTIFGSGLGHFYARRTRRAVIWLVVFFVLVAGAQVLVHVFEERAYFFLILVAVGAPVACLIDAFVTARRGPTVTASGPFRLAGYALMYGVSVALGLLVLLLSPMKIYHMQSGSMEPTLLVSERFLARTRSSFCEGLVVGRGDLVMVRRDLGGGASEILVKRVVGFEGDHVVIDASGLVVNDERITDRTREPIVIETRLRGPVLYDAVGESFAGTSSWRVLRASAGDEPWGREIDTIVAEGTVFVLGDNRAGSRDSRNDEPVPVDAIVGKPLRVLFDSEFKWHWRDLRVRQGADCATS